MKLLYLLPLLFLLSCNSISKMNTNMENSNQMIQLNTAAIEKSAEVIQINTEAVKLSTQTLQESKEVIASNTALIEGSTKSIKEHPYVLPVIVILLLLALFLPSLILFFSFKKLSQKFELLLERLKKENH